MTTIPSCGFVPDGQPARQFRGWASYDQAWRAGDIAENYNKAGFAERNSPRPLGNTVKSDFRQAIRLLAKNPAFTVIAVLTLALGIGANSAIFTIANALLLRPLPYANPDRLVLVSGAQASARAENGRLSLPFFNTLHDRSRSFSGVAACTFENFGLTGRGAPEQISAARASWNFFDVLGVKPILGRTFTREEDQRGGAQVVLISYELWSRLFGRNPNAMGSSLTLETRDYTVIGVLPPQFSFPLFGTKVDIWAPRVFEMTLLIPGRVAAGGRYFQVIGRLGTGISTEQARAESQVLFEEYRSDNPGNYDATTDLMMQVGNLQDRLVANARPAILILSAVVGFVLLIACANVASLLFSRAVGRRKEFAIRAALGASRAVLFRQLLHESVLLGLMSGIVGVALGAVGTRLLSAFGEVTLAGTADISMDFRVLVFTMVISLGASVLFGLAPSLNLSKPDLNTMLRDEGRGTAGNRRRNRARSILVVAQVALSTILLIGSGLLIRSFVRLHSVDPGFQPRNLLTMHVSLRKYAQTAQSIAFYKAVLQRIDVLPGVTASAISTALPMAPTHQTPVLFEGHPAVELGKRPNINIQQISPDYAKALGIPLIAGRTFTDHDDAQSPRVAIINQTAVRQFWPAQNPIGERVWIGDQVAPVEVVGVFGDVHNVTLAAAPAAEVFLPFPQLPWTFLCFDIRTSVEPHSLIATVRREIAAVDRDQPVNEINTGEELLEASQGKTQFMMFLLGVFAATAFILAVIGIYGVIAYAVAQRTQELGIRVALGATKADILRLVIGNGLILTVAGILTGLAGSIVLTRLMTTVLYQTSATDPLTFAASAILFTVAATLASYLPARRAIRIDPTDALRGQ
jgi:predicted permease